MTAPMIIEAESFYDEIHSLKAVTKNCLQELRSVQVLYDSLEYLLIWQLSGLVGAKLKEFYHV